MGLPSANESAVFHGMPEAILFDLDGTLTNTDALHFQIWREFLLEYGLEVDREFYDRHFSGRLNQDILVDILPQLSMAEAIALGVRKEAEFRHRAIEALVPLPGVLDVLDWLESRNLKKAVVTNAPRQNALFMLQVLKVDHRFPLVIIGEELEFAKPHPLPYLTALEILGVAPNRAIVFEDSPTGITAGVKAGVFTVGVASTQAPEALEALGANLVIADFTDSRVMPLLQGK
ncbi:MAG: HAD family phosphatase [Leptolyngbyaceae bacterium]|nr:HAD family phosphatase [Leptolyngbyaceae bacterium]